MADQRNGDLPEGTDAVIEGANVGAIATDPTAPDQGGQTITIGDTSLVEEKTIPAPRGDAERPVTGSGSPEGGLGGEPSGGSRAGGASSAGAQALTEKIRSSGERIASQAGDKARGLVGQGLERASEALANVAKMVGDTAQGIDERLGNEYGDYARRAAGSIESVANSIAGKDPDELIEDTRTFVRNSPGIALAGAAVVGFVVARMVKSGLSAGSEQDGSD